MLLSKTFLDGVIGAGVGVTAPGDQYEYHSLIYLCFKCESCDTRLYPDAINLSVDDPVWFQVLAKYAREHGWVISPPSADSHYDLTALCPKCASKHSEA